MARLQVRDPYHPPPVVRYGFDRKALLAQFGDADRISELCSTFGLPQPGRRQFRTIILTLDTLALLLELGERMHRPVDLYQFVIQVR